MKWFSLESVVTILLVMLYFCIPLVFAHMSDLFGVYLPVYPDYSYESVKVIFFWILVFILSIFVVLHHSQEINFQPLFLVLLGIIFTSVMLSDYPNVALLGSAERLHGGIFFLGLLLFALILKYTLTSQRREKIINATLYTLPILFCYSIIQFFGLDPLFSHYSFTVFSHPIFATFGNSAYLAGYVLLLLPITLISTLSRTYKILLFLMIAVILLLTQSITALLLWVWYSIYQCCRYREFQYWWQLITLLIVVILVLWTLYAPYLEGKMGSLITRWDIMSAGISIMNDNPSRLILWYGPDTLAVFLSEHPVELLRLYLEEWWSLHSFHNVFLDVLFSFWIVWLIAFLWVLMRWLLSATSRWQIEVICLFLFFFSFNIASVGHWVILIFALFPLAHVTHKKTSNSAGI